MEDRVVREVNKTRPQMGDSEVEGLIRGWFEEDKGSDQVRTAPAVVVVRAVTFFVQILKFLLTLYIFFSCRNFVKAIIKYYPKSNKVKAFKQKKSMLASQK